MKRVILVTLQGATRAQAEAALAGVQMEAEMRGCRTHVSRLLDPLREHSYVVVVEEEDRDAVSRL